MLGRLKRRPEFLRVAASRRKWVAPGLILQAHKRQADEAGGAGLDAGSVAAVRLGFTASRKVGNAVARNRARRRLREAARLVLPGRVPPGYDLVLVARAATLRRPFTELIGDLEAALRGLGLVGPARGGGEGGPRKTPRKGDGGGRRV